ncbi:MAG: hypothetical protein U1F83_11145 [Verrucomicrobiota bacterium]
MQTNVFFSASSEHVNHEVQNNEAHHISVIVDSPTQHVLFECSSREALFELGRTLMEEALFGTGELELYPLVANGKALVVNGARLVENSARVFVHFPKEGQFTIANQA